MSSLPPHATPPPTGKGKGPLARQRSIIKLVIGLLLVMAALALVVVPRLATPLRVFVAASDVILAAVLWLVLRQKFKPQP